MFGGGEKIIAHKARLVHSGCKFDGDGDDERCQGARGQALGHATAKDQRFEEFGYATCHKVTPGNMELTPVGAKLAHLHLCCVEVEKLVASTPASKR
jgi:hypothetical protein